jgi:Tol biopolymer transport system component/DNA-binding winged helix-turn-helix (wHTH) protein
MKSKAPIVRFGLFEFHRRTGELRKNGAKVRLEGQPIQLLELLLERPQELVTPDEIRARLWPDGTVVEFEHSIKSAVKRLRQALDDDAEAPRYVQTLPRRGYRFIAPVRAQDAFGSRNGHSDDAAIQELSVAPGSRWYPRSAPAVVAGILILGAVLTAWFARPWAGTPSKLTERQITANPPEDYIRAAAISPDGRSVAYKDLTGLYVRSVDSGETRSVPLPTDLSNALGQIEWFPDGAKLLAVLNRPEPYGLWVIPVLGQAQPRLAYPNGVDPSISPDGQSVAFMSCCKLRSFQEILVGGINGETPRQLVAAKQQGSDEAQLENETVWYPVWSPDGRWIAYARRWKTGRGSQTSAIEVRPASGGPAKTLVSQESVPSASSLCAFLLNGPCMIWSPDGRLVFRASQTAESPSGQTKYSLWRLRVDPRTGEATTKPLQLMAWSDFQVLNLSVTQDGKSLSMLRQRVWSDVYLGELGSGNASMKPPHRFTLDNRGILTLDSWTADGQAILFSSSQNGRTELFRKGLNENIAEAIVRGPEGYRCARRTADGSWMLYVAWTAAAPNTMPSPDRLMRRSVAGGPSELVLEEPGGGTPDRYVWDYKCPLKPGSPCVLGEKHGDDLIFYSLDPVRGKGKPLGKVGVPQPQMDWDLSPDGSRLALIGRAQHDAPIGVLNFSEGRWQEISPVRRVGLPLSIAWAADGKGFFMASWDNDSINLLHVTLAGRVDWLMRNGYRQFIGKLLPSPDGKYLAYQCDTTDSNVWLLENF